MRPDRAVALVLEVDGLRRGRGAVGDDLLLPGARARAEAMQRVIEGDADRFATPLTTSLATPAVADDVSMPLTSEFVGRPGLDPGNLGPDPSDPSMSLEIHLSWSEAAARPPASADVLSNLSLWLHNWLHEVGSGSVGVIFCTGADGARFELRVEAP